MLHNSIIVFHQVIVMFLLMAVGFVTFRLGFFDNHTTERLSKFLNTLVLPFVMLNAFDRDFDPALARTLALTAAAAALVFAVSILLVGRLYPANRPGSADCRLCAILSNNGFMALPLVSAMFGELGVFLASAHIVVMTVVLWTYGVSQLDPGRKRSVKRILLNPGVIAAALGIGLFLAPFRLPADLASAAGHMANLNTPLAMLILGGYLAQIDLRACFTDRALWRISAVRLLVIPLVTVALLLWFPITAEAKLTLLVGCAAPSAIAAAMFAQMYGTDYLFSTRAVALTTILSLVTLPGVIALMSFLMEVI